MVIELFARCFPITDKVGEEVHRGTVALYNGGHAIDLLSGIPNASLFSKIAHANSRRFLNGGALRYSARTRSTLVILSRITGLGLRVPSS